MPRADFACLSKKCKTEAGEASVYELPVGSVRCPVCSSKRITRLFNAVNISSGLAKQTDAMFEPAYAEALKKVDGAAVARANKANGKPFMVPLKDVSGAVSDITGGTVRYTLPGTLGKSDYKDGHIMARPPSDETAIIHQVKPRVNILKADREWKIGTNAKGELVPVKA